jgi:uncharacterized protein YegL
MLHIIIMIDTSYSMYHRIVHIINSLNNFVNKLKEKNQHDLYLTVVQFNDKLKYICKLTNINKIGIFQRNQFSIYGSTALYDSISELLLDFGIDSEIKQTLFIISDGEDNLSKNNNTSTNELCEKAKNFGRWDIIHCNIDVSKLNVQTVIFNPDNIDDISSLFDNLLL